MPVYYAGQGCGTRGMAARSERSKRRRTILMHRQIMRVIDEPHTAVVDHIDGDCLNNRRENLRVVTQHENCHNRRRLNRNNTSGFRGVSWSRRGGWAAQVMVRRKPIRLGYFPTAELAAEAVRAFRAARGLDPEVAA